MTHTGIEKLFADLRAIETPAMQNWRPKKILDIGLRITAAGEWRHENAPIARMRMVKFFASLLRRESGGAYFLVTPHIKYPVQVDDAPFLAVEMRAQGNGATQKLIFRTNMDDTVTAGKTHPITLTNQIPRIKIRANLHAKLTRAVHIELCELATPAEAGAQTYGVHSAGEFFALGKL